MMNPQILGWTVLLAAILGFSMESTGAELIHRYCFDDGTADDSVGACNGSFQRGATAPTDSADLLGATGKHVDLGSDLGKELASLKNVTIEIWATSAADCPVLGRIFDFNSEVQWESDGKKFQTLYLAPNNGNDCTQLTYNADGPGGDHIVVSVPNTADGKEHYYAMTIASKDVGVEIVLYLDGVKKDATTFTPGKRLEDLSHCFLGRSHFGEGYSGSINECRIWSNVLSADEVAENAKAGPTTVGTEAEK